LPAPARAAAEQARTLADEYQFEAASAAIAAVLKTLETESQP
jgi:hypothetical protein